MDIAGWSGLLVLLLKFFLILVDKMSKTPVEARREELAKLDAAIDKAKSSKDLSELSKYLGGKL